MAGVVQFLNQMGESLMATEKFCLEKGRRADPGQSTHMGLFSEYAFVVEESRM